MLTVQRRHVPRPDRAQWLGQEHAARRRSPAPIADERHHPCSRAATSRARRPSSARAPGLSLKFQITSVLPELSVYDNVLLATSIGRGPAALLLLASRRALDGEVMRPARSLPADRSRRRPRRRAESRSAAVARDRHGAGAPAEAAAARRADRRHEPGGAPGDRRAAALRSRRIARWSSSSTTCDFIKDICDYLTVLDQGRVLDDGDVETDPALAQGPGGLH